MSVWKKLMDLYVTFIKIGGFTLGGGYAMIPIIQHEAVDNKKWVSEEEMIDFITIGQSLPGVVGINMATTIGNKIAGIKGAVAATLGMITPSFIVIIIIAAIFDEFQKWEIVKQAFTGVRAAVAALIIIAVIRIAKSSIKNIFQAVIAAVTAIAILFLGVSPPYMLLLSAAVTVAYSIISVRKKTKKETEGERQIDNNN